MPKKRGFWNEAQMEEALLAVKNGTSVRTAAKLFQIPRRTLRNHIKSGTSAKKLGRPAFLTPQQEAELCSRIFRLADVGMPLNSKVIRRSVYDYCQINNSDTPFHTKEISGRKWLKLFLGRHPDVAKRKSQFMNPARAAKLNRFIVNDYFQKLKEVMLKLNLMQNPQRIFNIDEKGCRLDLHKSKEVFARKGTKRVHLISQEHAENVSIVGCGNALGQIIPPMILFKGKRKKEEWMDNLPHGTVIEMTDKGSMTTAVFIKWVSHFAKFKPPGEVLLIFDGASSHLDAGIVDAAAPHNITLFCLPSNTTHELQPMDKAVFKAFESYWDDEVMLYWTNNPNRTINKFSFGKIFSKVWPKATAACNVISGFRATGVYPFDPNIIPDIAFAPSEITENRSLLTTEESLKNNVPLLEMSEKKLHSTSSTLRNSAPKKQKKTTCKQFSSSESSDEDISLHDSSSSYNGDDEKTPVSFNEILITPEIQTTKNIGNRKKALNYRAQEVVRALFEDQKKEKASVEKELPEPMAGPSGIKKKTERYQGGIKKKTAVFEDQKKERASVEKKLPEPMAGPSGIKKKTERKKDSWFCHVCQDDAIKDMRLCIMCNKYVHEECVGLSAKDKCLKFICPGCEDSD